MPPRDFQTFVKDLRPFGNGTPVAYKYDASVFSGDAYGELSAGEMVAFDTTSNSLIRFERTGANGRLVGITRDSATGLRRLGNQAPLTPTDVSVFTTGVHELMGTVGDTYTHADAVYMSGTDTTKVTKTAGGGTQVGTIHNPLGLSYAGAVRVPVLIDEYTITQK